MISPKTTARVAGSLYLLASLLFVFATYVRSTVRGGGAAQIADHVRASAPLFRLGVASDLVSATLFLLTAMALYMLLQHVSRTAAGAMVVFVAVLVTVAYVNDVNELTALTIATDGAYARSLGTDASNALVALSFQAQSNGLAISELLWGVWLVPLSYLVIRSRQFPRVVGILLALAAVNWLAQFVADVPTPGIPLVSAVSQAGGVGELVFVGWLLVFGIRPPLPQPAGDRSSLVALPE